MRLIRTLTIAIFSVGGLAALSGCAYDDHDHHRHHDRVIYRERPAHYRHHPYRDGHRDHYYHDHHRHDRYHHREHWRYH